MDFFKKVSLKDIIGDDIFFKPKKIDIMKEENIIFHLTTDQGTMISHYSGGENVGNAGEDNEIDIEKQK